MKKIFSISGFIIVFVFGVVALVSASNHWVFTEPSQAPPAGNVAPPLNVGGDGQAKVGGLILNTGGSEVGLMVQQGNVGIGMTDKSLINARLSVLGDVSIRGLASDSTSPYLTIGDTTQDSYGAPTYIGLTPEADTCPGNDTEFYYSCSAADSIADCTDVGLGNDPEGNPAYWKRQVTCNPDGEAYGIRTNLTNLEIGLTSTPTTPFLKLNNNGVLLISNNVGINNPNPAEKLHVGGSIRANRYIDDDATFYVDSNVTSVMNSIDLRGAITGSAWVGYKWVPNGGIATCTTNGNTKHSARVFNGRIQVRAEVVSGPFYNTADSGWQDGMKTRVLVTGYTVPPGTYITTELINKGPSSVEKDLFGDGRSNVAGTATCIANWP